MTAPVPTADPLFPAQWLDVAERICARFYAEFPTHDARYGARGRAYCAHDNAYLVAWLIDALDMGTVVAFRTNVTWLHDVLAARDFPMDAFRRNLELLGDMVALERPDDAARIGELIRSVSA